MDAEADKIRSLGAGEATRVKLLGDADAERAARVGIAEAMAIEEQVRAYGGPRLQLTQRVMDRVAQAIETAKVDVVPRVVVCSGGGAAGRQPGASLFENLLSGLLADGLSHDAASGECDPGRAAEANCIRERLIAVMAPTKNPAA